MVMVAFVDHWDENWRLMSTNLEKIALLNKDELVLVKVDVNGLKQLASDYAVVELPTFVLVREKRELGRLVGADEGKLTNWVA